MTELRYLNWSHVLGVFSILMLIVLLVALTIRHTFRMKLYNKQSDQHFNSKFLPVSFLEPKTGRVRDMWLSPNEYVVFAGLVKQCQRFRHGLCTDTPGWTQFAYFAAANAYNRLRDASDVQQSITVPSLLAKSIEDVVTPYLLFLKNKLNKASKEDLDELQLLGIPDRPVLSLTQPISLLVEE